jgi:hypothetical protein
MIIVAERDLTDGWFVTRHVLRTTDDRMSEYQIAFSVGTTILGVALGSFLTTRLGKRLRLLILAVGMIAIAFSSLGPLREKFEGRDLSTLVAGPAELTLEAEGAVQEHRVEMEEHSQASAT